VRDPAPPRHLIGPRVASTAAGEGQDTLPVQSGQTRAAGGDHHSVAPPTNRDSLDGLGPATSGSSVFRTMSGDRRLSRLALGRESRRIGLLWLCFPAVAIAQRGSGGAANAGYSPKRARGSVLTDVPVREIYERGTVRDYPTPGR
jgi:hypothetical protein